MKIRNKILLIIFILSLSAILLIYYSIYFIEPDSKDSQFFRGISAFIISIFGILAGYLIKAVLDEKLKKRNLFDEILKNIDKFQEFNLQLLETKKSWNDGNISWIKKEEPVLFMANRLYGTQYLSDNAFQSFVSAGYAESLPKVQQYWLSIYYQHCREFSDNTQFLECKINFFLSKKGITNKIPSTSKIEVNSQLNSGVRFTHESGISADKLTASMYKPATYSTPSNHTDMLCQYDAEDYLRGNEFPTYGINTFEQNTRVNFVFVAPNPESNCTHLNSQCSSEVINQSYDAFDFLITQYDSFFKSDLIEIKKIIPEYTQKKKIFGN